MRREDDMYICYNTPAPAMANTSPGVFQDRCLSKYGDRSVILMLICMLPLIRFSLLISHGLFSDRVKVRGSGNEFNG